MNHDCVDEATLYAFVQGRLSPEERAQVEVALEACSDCTERMHAELDRMDADTVIHDVMDVDLSDSALLPRGGVVGPYVVRDLVATGRAGPTYLASSRAGDDTPVALKLLDPDLAGTEPPPDADQLRELVHPNLVTVLDFVPTDRRLAVSMAWAPGHAVPGWIRSARPPWTAVVDVFAQAARGLQAVHEAGLVHGRVAASDIVVGSDGTAKMLPRGFAAKVPGLRAPERDRPGHDGARADQFEFAAALYESIYGQPPFESADDDERSGAVSLRAPPPNRAVSPWAQRAIERGLDPDPTSRHASMGAMATALSGPGSGSARTLALVVVLVLVAGALVLALT